MYLDERTGLNEHCLSLYETGGKTMILYLRMIAHNL